MKNLPFLCIGIYGFLLASCDILSAASDQTEFLLQNEAFQLKVSTQNGLNPYSLLCRQPDGVLADGDYSFGFGRPSNVTYKSRSLADGGQEIVFTGQSGDLKVEHLFRFPRADWFEEQITVQNTGEQELLLADDKPNPVHPRIRCGFVRSGQDGPQAATPIADTRFLAVPYLKGIAIPFGHKDFSFTDVVEKSHEFHFDNGQLFEPLDTCVLGSEGWVWTGRDQGIVIIKYSQELMEHSILDTVEKSGQGDAGGKSLRFGGCGAWHGDPEAALRIAPGATVRMGITRYIRYSGDWKTGFYQFRQFMAEKGHRFPKGFNPPVHWNELYDNPLWWTDPESLENRDKMYRLEHMEEEAAKAREVGCEALYLDPGWDTMQGSTVWAEDRLLTCAEFCKLMQDKYGLQVSLHTPLAWWNKPEGYPSSVLARDAQGNTYRTPRWNQYPQTVCSGSEWFTIKLERLLKLAEAGVVYFMFDGPNFTGPCTVKSHGHVVPYTREAHMRRCTELGRKLHEKYPDLIIEMHDMIAGAGGFNYVPTYYLQNDQTFNDVWAFEFMWDPMADLLSRRSVALYYYNLGYDLPLYIHVNLKGDNANALMFWWNASLCRHLGIGGKHPDPLVWQAHKDAMKTYLRLKSFFTQGEFYGLDEMIHVHTLKEKNAAVINCFNLAETPETKTFTFALAEVGLSPQSKYEIQGAAATRRQGDTLEISVALEGKDSAVIEVIPVS